MAKKKAAGSAKNDLQVAQSKEMQELVEQSLSDMRQYEAMLEKADDPDEAKLRIKQMYFSNLKQAGQPLALSQRVLADLLTRMDVHRVMGKDIDPLSDEYLKVLDQINKNIKLVKDMEVKSVNVNVSKVNDSNMKIVDAEIMEEMFE
jgi:hypothetical protein